MFTSADVWLFQGLAGIQPHPAARAFDRVLIKPRPPPPTAGLTWCNASLTTVRGVVATSWTLAADGHFVLTVTTPPNMDVELWLPGAASATPVSGGIHTYSRSLSNLL